MRSDAESFMQVARPMAKAPPAAETAPAKPAAAVRIAAPVDDVVATRQVAVVVVHGMGQQLPFETLDAVVRGLREADRRAAGAGAALPKVDVRLARVATEDLPRAEIDLVSKTTRTSVHLYEAYWAPITEGRVQLRDVWRFLVKGGLNGWRNSRAEGGFVRWMFGGPKKFENRPATTRLFALIVLVLAALTALNVAAVGVAAAVVAGKEHALLSEATQVDVAAVLVLLLVFAGASCLGLFATKARAFLYAALLTVVVCGLLVAAIPLAHRFGDFALFHLSAGPRALVHALAVPLWLALFGASLFVRSFLVQYAGDVAAYVSPHELDKFQDIRTRVKKTVRDVADAVYRHSDANGKHVYDKVAVVAHSLGSVAAYDCLNGLLNCDILDPAKSSDVKGRTSLFLTFGSPLDKTAFVFKAQGHDLDEPREALAAAVQPLIQDYAHRTFPWVNVYSEQDVISGPLDYYDDPSVPATDPKHVQNKPDPTAKTPLVAHTEYWNGTLVYEELLAKL